MDNEEYVVALRIFHPTLAADEIELALKRDSRIKNTVGQPRKTPEGSILGGVYKETFCTFPLIPKKKGYFVDGITMGIEILLPKKQFFVDVTQSGGRAEFFIGVFGESTFGFTIDVQLMKILSEMCLTISVDAYFFDDE
jgi:hypothetical protein